MPQGWPWKDKKKKEKDSPVRIREAMRAGTGGRGWACASLGGLNTSAFWGHVSDTYRPQRFWDAPSCNLLINPTSSFWASSVTQALPLVQGDITAEMESCKHHLLSSVFLSQLFNLPEFHSFLLSFLLSFFLSVFLSFVFLPPFLSSFTYFWPCLQNPEVSRPGNLPAPQL